ncbi:MAG: glycosyl hydrolase family 8 [Terrimicrobiaceae bacterium]|nr:glycosyl hydrolase family 8 [Terrimicrobiaceae bacterium]
MNRIGEKDGKRLAGIALAALVLLGLCCYWFVVISDPWRLPPRDWALFKKRFISPQGRVIDNGNGDITHSEGQGYGMLIAEAFGDRAAFDKIWRWTRENLQTRQDDKLISWLWKPGQDGGGSVADANNASDAEVLVAWALVRASKRWGAYAYQQAAAEILVDLRRVAVKDTPQGPVLLPGSEGFLKDGGVLLNPSYYIFPAFGAFSKSFPGGGWDALSKSGLELVEKARFGRWALTPDWVLSGETFSLKTSFPPDFGYNAIRIPLHLAWRNPKSPLLEPYANFWKQFPDLSKIPSTVNLETNAFGTDPALPGMQAIARFVLACESGTRFTVRDISPVMSDEPYYSASLKLLTKLAVRESLGGKR